LKRAKLLILITLILVVGFSLYAQTGTFGSKKSKAQVYVTFNANVRGARVYVGKYQGTVPFRVKLAPGVYNVRVTAPGYQTFSGRINVTTKNYQSINITLQPLTVLVTISTINVKGARIFLDGAFRGTTPANLRLPPKNYNLRLEADGFMPFNTVITVGKTQNQRFNFTLQPAMATLNVSVPIDYINKKVKNPRRLIKIWVDNKLINPNGEIRNLQITPGLHIITLESGGLVTVGKFEFMAGQVYNIQLNMQLILVQ